MELTNVMRKAADSASPPAGSLRDGVEALATMLSCYAPYTAEEVWSRLGHDVRAGDSVHASTWPTADPALLVDDTVTCVVQVAGKVRDKLEVPPGIDEDELRDLALASARVQESLDGRGVRTVIVRAPKLVNIVPA
jgi:leucyl-tRNA synthetase